MELVVEPQTTSTREAEPRKCGSIQLCLPIYCFTQLQGPTSVRRHGRRCWQRRGEVGEAGRGGVEAPTEAG
jgi:hypothetical protein